MTSTFRASPLALSLALHFTIVTAIGLGFFISKRQSTTMDVNVVVLDQPRLAPQADIDLTKPMPPPPPEPEKKARKVFGATRNTIRSAAPTEGVEIKAGNTIASAPDNEKLNEDDPTRLPIPVEEYLISSPPQLLSSIKPQYPREARDRNIEGAVRVEILIDRQGVVREAKLIQGLGFGTEAAALEAAQKLRFKPAEASGQTVAVRIQFVIHFELER